MSLDVGQLLQENLLWVILASVAVFGCIVFIVVLIKKMRPKKKKPEDDGTTYTLFNKQGVQEEKVIYADGKIDTIKVSKPAENGGTGRPNENRGGSSMKIDGKVSIGMTPYSSIRESGNPNTEAPVTTPSPVKKNPADPVGSLTQATPLLHISSGLKRPPTSAPPGYMGQGPIITGAGQSSASPNHPNNNTGSGYQSAASKFVGNESSAFFSAKGDFSVSGIANPNNQSRNNNILVPSREDDRDPEDQTMYSAVSGNNSAFYSAQPSRFVSAFGDNTQRGSTQDTRNILGEVDQSLPIKILPPGLLTDPAPPTNPEP